VWIRPIELISFDGVVLRLRAQNSYTRLWFESNFLANVLKTLQELGYDVRVKFESNDPNERPPVVEEGALIRLAARASLSKNRIDLEFAQETLGMAGLDLDPIH
jgi:chromosomal replication initiation ATPase DnaA